MNDLELKRKRIETLVKYACLPVVGFFVAPFILIAVKGLIGILVAAVLSVVAVNLAPWFGSMVANWRLKALKYEASKNPIETLQNDYKSRLGALQNFRDSIQNFAAEVRTFGDKLGGFKNQYPAESGKFDGQFRQMKELLEIRKGKYEEAKGNLSLYDAEISKARAIWDMAQAAAQMNKAAGVNAEEFYAKIQVETALDSVQKSLNVAFSDLEISLLDEKKPSAAQQSSVIDAGEVPAAIRQKVQI